MTNHEIAVLQAELRILYGIADLTRNFAHLDRQLMKGADVFKERDAAKQDLHDLFSDAPYAPIVDRAHLNAFIRQLAENAVERENDRNSKVAA